MNAVCEVCGAIGYKHLLLCCSDCKGAHTHQYCLKKVLYDASLEDWFCDECNQRNNEGSYSRSLGKVAREMPSSHSRFDSTSQQSNTKRLESATVVGPGQQKSKSYVARKGAYLKKKHSSGAKSLQKKHTGKTSNMRGKGINREQWNLSTGQAGSASSSGYTLGDTGQSHVLKPLEGLACKSMEAPQSLATQFKGFDSNAQTVVSGSKESTNLRIEQGNLVHGQSGDEQKCMDRKILASVLNNSNESELSKMNKCSVTREVNSKAGNKPSDTLLVSHQHGERLGEVSIASFQDISSSDAHFTHGHPNKLHDSLKPSESPNPGSVFEPNRIGETVDDSSIRKLPFSAGKVPVKQVSGLKHDSGPVLSSKDIDHDKETNQHGPVVCKHMEVNSGQDNGNMVGARHEKYWASNKDKPDTHGYNNSNISDALTLEREKNKVRFQLDHEASNELQERSMAANAPHPSTLQNGTLDKALSDSSMGLMSKENNCLPSKQLDLAYSTSSLEISSKAKFVLEATATEVEISDPVQNLRKDSPKKRRRLILTSDDEDEEERAEDVQQENVNHQPIKCNEPMTKHRIDTEYYVEETVRTGDLNDQNPMNDRPKKRRRYIVENEDEEDIEGSANADCALNNASKWSLNDNAMMASQTPVAADHPLESRPSDAEYADQQYHICSQPLDKPVWSGVLKIDNEVFLKLDAHLSNKACQRVCELSGLLQTVVEVTTLSRLQAWPEIWTSSGPTDDSIGLFFFPHDPRQTEVSTRLVNRIIKSDYALKVTVGIAELLIFPSVLLPEQYHSFQGKHYLWGVFRLRKDILDNGVTVEKHETGEGHQEQGLLDQQDEALDGLSDQETCAVKHVDTEDQLQMECDPEVQKDTMKFATSDGITSFDSNWSSAKPDSSNAGSNCYLQPIAERKLHAPEDVEQQENFTSSSEWNASSITKQSSAAMPTEHGNKKAQLDSEPSTTKLFGFVAARTPRSQQLLQEMVSEGALLFPVPQEIAPTNSVKGSITEVVSSALKADAKHEAPQAFDFVSMDTGHEDPVADPEACLELFPVRQEHIGWAPRAEVGGEVDLNLSLGKRRPTSSLPQLL